LPRNFPHYFISHKENPYTFDVKNVQELNVVLTKLLNIRDVVGARRGQG